jgi:hypothetical protein
MVGLWRFELPTYGLGIQRAVLIGVENFQLYMQTSLRGPGVDWFCFVLLRSEPKSRTLLWHSAESHVFPLGQQVRCNIDGM